MKKMTIFTPTYNRAYILPRLYKSLCTQTCKEFEWLIVDDGSEDETENLVKWWMKQKKIVIRYYKQPNGGKQRAHNVGVEKSDGELFVCVDSDDYVTPEFVEKHLKCREKLNDKSYAGIISLKGYKDGRPTGNYFPKDLKRTTLTNLYGKRKFYGDATLVYYTKILRQYPFIVDEGEKFIGEGFVYYQIDQKYDLLVLPEILMIVEYLDDGYSKNVRKITKDNPKSYTRLKKQSIQYSKTWKEKFIQTILYMVGCRLSGQQQVKNAPYKILAILAYLPAWLVWKIFYKNA